MKKKILEALKNKPIVGFEDYKINQFGEVINKHDKMLKHSTDRYGYKFVTLYRNKKPNIKYIHRLVALSFIPNPDNKETVNHINGNKGDNKLENLEWATYSENIRHAYKLGLSSVHKQFGEKSGTAKLNRQKVAEIRALTATRKYKQKEIAEMYGVKRETIRKVTNNLSWI